MILSRSMIVLRGFKCQLRAVSLKAFHWISHSTKLLPYIFTINANIHPNNEIAGRIAAIPSISLLEDS